MLQSATSIDPTKNFMLNTNKFEMRPCYCDIFKDLAIVILKHIANIY